MGSRVELFAAIRRDARIEDLSIRELARRHGVHRRTVRQALSAAEPPTRKQPTRSSPRLDPFKDAIDGMLRADLDAPRKQRHTATRILARLVAEHEAAGLSYSTVRDYVRVRRAQIDLEGVQERDAAIRNCRCPGAPLSRYSRLINSRPCQLKQRELFPHVRAGFHNRCEKRSTWSKRTDMSMNVRTVFRSWPSRTAGDRWCGRSGWSAPSGWTASRPARVLCPGRWRGRAACPGRRPRDR
jgi:hypothetical protein